MEMIYYIDIYRSSVYRLGRARAVRSMGGSATASQAKQASKDYETYFMSTSRLDDDDDTVTSSNNNMGNNNRDDGRSSFSDAIIDGMQRNPYAAWEWGMVERVAQNYDRAAELHGLAASAFDYIGDRPRSVICSLDRGLDMASGMDGGGGKGGGSSGGGDKKEKKLEAVEATRRVLEDAISSTVDVGGRDVELLQRVVAKEGEARVALSGVLWNAGDAGGGDGGAAESQFGTACARLDELNADYRTREADRIRGKRAPPIAPRGASLGYSIDDIVGAEEAGCSRFKNEKFVEEKLVWSDGLRTLVRKFLTLSR